nr:MAG TPA: hypothetical protein [Caudoviricetes sp.]
MLISEVITVSILVSFASAYTEPLSLSLIS